MEVCLTGSEDAQVSAAIELYESQYVEAVPAISTLLSSEDAVVRSTGALALGYLGREQQGTVGPALVALLDDPEIIVRSDAVEAIGRLHYAQATTQIAIILRADPDPLVRADAAETLGDLGPNDLALAALVAALTDPDDTVRAFAAISIGLIGTSMDLQTLADALERESSSHVKAELHGAQYRLGEREALASLLALLNVADESLGTIVLNLLEDLLTRKVSPAVASDSADIRTALDNLTQRLPPLRAHTDEIRALL
jgi:HEAT repeat protein